MLRFSFLLVSLLAALAVASPALAAAPSNTVLPSITVPPHTPANPVEGDVLTAGTGTWSGDTPMSFSYQWYRCSSSCVALSGATSSTYTPVWSSTASQSDINKTLEVKAYASNAFGSSNATSARTLAVKGRPPQNTSPPTIDGWPYVGQTLTSGLGTWSDSPHNLSITKTRQWQRCLASSGCVAPGDWSNISGATASAYTVAAAVIDNRIRLQVRACTTFNCAYAYSDPTAVVTSPPSPPVLVFSPAVTGNARVGLELTASNGSWSPDTLDLQFGRQWQRCLPDGSGCADIAGAQAASYGVAPADLGFRLRVVVTATNVTASSTGTSTTTDVVTVQMADLKLAKVGAPYDTVGAEVSYQLVVTNDGPDTARDVVITQASAFSGITILSATPTPDGTCTEVNPLNCSFGDLASAASRTITIVASLESLGNFGAEIVAASETDDPVPSNSEVDVRLVGLADDQALAAQFRPALLFDSQELWRPLRIADFVSESFDGERHRVCTSAGCADLTSEAGLTADFDWLDIRGQDGTEFFTSLDCDRPGIGDCAGGSPSVLYYEPTRDPYKGYRYLDFWWFYRFNDSPLPTGDHEGDWEGLTIAVDPTGPPNNTGTPTAAYALYSAHDDRTWSAYLGNPSNVHTPAYVGWGTHGSYPQDCDPSEGDDCGSLENSYDGEQPWLRNDDVECNESCVLPLAEYEWADWEGRWGVNEEGVLSGGASPGSPATQGRYECAKLYYLTDCPLPPGSAGSVGAAATDEHRLSPVFLAAGEPTSPRTFSIDSCDAWRGDLAVVTVCSPTALRKAIADRSLDERVSSNVVIDGFRGRMISAPGITQAIGAALRPGERVVVRGPRVPGQEVTVRGRARGKEWKAVFDLPGLSAGETAAIETEATPDGVRFVLEADSQPARSPKSVTEVGNDG